MGDYIPQRPHLDVCLPNSIYPIWSKVMRIVFVNFLWPTSSRHISSWNKMKGDFYENINNLPLLVISLDLAFMHYGIWTSMKILVEMYYSLLLCYCNHFIFGHCNSLVTRWRLTCSILVFNVRFKILFNGISI